MEFRLITILALLCVTLVGSDASESAKDYWQSIWPNTPVPKPLWDLLLPYSEKPHLPIKAEEIKQYWTVFFEYDLHPHKIMNLGLDKDSDHKPFGVHTWKRTSQPLDLHNDFDNQPFGFPVWAKTSQPLDLDKDFDNQPFGFPVWAKTSQPLDLDKDFDNQPFGFPVWAKTSQPLDRHQHSDKKPFGTLVSDRTSQHFRSGAWHGKKERERDLLYKFCGNAAAIGEDKYCAKSLKSMVDFAISKLGKNIKVLSSSFAQNQDQYVVEEVNKIGEKGVMCHRINLETVVFYCHQINATTIYMVPLEASDGTKAKALTICHHDTRGMNPDMLYAILKVKPGTIPVCHFIGKDTIAWVPNPVTSESNHLCVI